MTVSDLIAKLQEYPSDGHLTVKPAGNSGKIILVVDGYEVDPVFQITNPKPAGGLTS